MDTTTKCQHALVIGGLSLLLIILACVAFLSPVQDIASNNIVPVTRTVTYPTGWSDVNGRTHTYPTTSRRDLRNTRSTRSTRRYSTRSTVDRDDIEDAMEDRREQRKDRLEEIQDKREEAQEDIKEHFDDIKDQKESDMKKAVQGAKTHHADGAPVSSASLYPAAAVGAGRLNRTKRSTDKSDEKKKLKDWEKANEKKARHHPTGHMSMRKNMSMPKDSRMMFDGEIGGLVPGQIYAICMHQHGDMQNGCGQMGPAFNEKGKHDRDAHSRKERSLARSAEEEDILERFKRSKGLSKKEQKKIRQYKEDHNGTLIGFAQANETGYANFSMPVPFQHQDACFSCGGTMGRGVTMRPVKGFPGDKLPHPDDAMADKFADMMMGNRKKRSADDRDHDHSRDTYQHKNQKHKNNHKDDDRKEDKSLLDKLKEKLRRDDKEERVEEGFRHEDDEAIMDHTIPLFADGEEMKRMNHKTKSGELRGEHMYDFMESPVACGVLGRPNLKHEHEHKH